MPVRAHQNISLKEVGHVIAQFYGGMCMYGYRYTVPTEKSCCHNYSKLKTANDRSILH